MSRARRPGTVAELVDAYAAWVSGAPDPEDLGNLDLFLTVRRDHLSQDLVGWRPGEVTTLLLELFPRRVQSDPWLLSDGPRVLDDWFEFLAQTGRLARTTAGRLRAELAEVAPHFASAMGDATRFGMATSLVGAMSADGIASDDLGAVERWMAEFNARPFEERLALTGGPGDEELHPPPSELVLPAVTLAGEDELRRAASAAPLVHRVRTLLDHVGQGIAVTQTGALRLADAKALAAVCGDEERLHRPEHWQREVRRMADLPGVAEAFELTALGELLVLSATRARLDVSHPGATDDLALVAALADAALEVGVFVGEVNTMFQPLVDAVGDELVGVLAALYAAGTPVPVDELVDGLVDDLGLDDAFARDTVRNYLERVAERFERLGVVSRLGVHVPAEDAWLQQERTTSVALTPLGTWWMRQVLDEAGVRAPVRGDLAASGAAALCDGLADFGVEDGEAEVQQWLAARTPDSAAGELAALLGDDEVARRQFALRLLEDLPAPESAVRPMLDVPAARPYARLLLEGRGVQVPETYRHPHDALVLFVDTAGLLVELDAVEEVAEQLSQAGDLPQQADLVRELWRVDSPLTEPVLTALAAHTPPPVAKAARTALHGLRSVRGSRSR